jgi:hypothetical protein
MKRQQQHDSGLLHTPMQPSRSSLDHFKCLRHPITTRLQTELSEAQAAASQHGLAPRVVQRRQQTRCKGANLPTSSSLLLQPPASHAAITTASSSTHVQLLLLLLLQRCASAAAAC